jgi:hypothetical protein
MNCTDDNSCATSISSHQDTLCGSLLTLLKVPRTQSATHLPNYTSQDVCDQGFGPLLYCPERVLEVMPKQSQGRSWVGAGFLARSGNPCSHIRLLNQRAKFVDNLVGKVTSYYSIFQVNMLNCSTDSSVQIVEAIWPFATSSKIDTRRILPLRTFIEETLRTSRTSYSTLQLALYYLILVKPHVPERGRRVEQFEDLGNVRALQCGRRMFLAALILASKYLHDRNYSARAWSKICRLDTEEINQNEMAFLKAVDWRLCISDIMFQRWTEIVLRYSTTSPPFNDTHPWPPMTNIPVCWKTIILELNPELDNIEDIVLCISSGV